MTVRMTDCGRERIRFVGHRQLFEPENGLHHVLDLRLVRAAPPDDRQFDLPGGVFVNDDAASKRTADCSRAGLTELQCAIRVAMKEHALDGHLLRSVLDDELSDAGIDVVQSSGEVAVADTNAAARNMPGRAAV